MQKLVLNIVWDILSEVDGTIERESMSSIFVH